MGAVEVPGLHRVAQPGTLWCPLAAEEKRELRVVETDYSHYAIVQELQQREQELTTALQLLSGYWEWGWAPTAPRGRRWAPVGGQWLGAPSLPLATTLAPNMLAPRRTQGIHCGVNETSHQKYPRFTVV